MSSLGHIGKEVREVLSNRHNFILRLEPLAGVEPALLVSSHLSYRGMCRRCGHSVRFGSGNGRWPDLNRRP